MFDRRTFLAGAGLSALAVAQGGAALAAAPQDAALTRLLDGISHDLLVEYPESATMLGLDTGGAIALHGRLTDRSIAGEAARGAACAARLAKLKAFDGSRLTGLDAINLETTVYAHELAARGHGFGYGDDAVLNIFQAESNTPYAVSQGTGFFATIPDFLDTMHKIEHAADAEAYLARLSALARGLDQEDARMARDAAKGSIAPDFLLDTTLAQQTGYRATPIAQWGLVTSLAKRTAAAGIAGDWAQRAERICTAEVAPALDRQIAALKSLRAKATHDAGCWKLPEGDAYYRWLLEVGTTTTMSPDEVHALGLEQTRSIGAEMDTLLRAQGLTRGSVGARMTALSKNPAHLFPDTDAGKAQLLDYLNEVIAKLRAQLPRAFGIAKRADLVIKRVPPSIEAGAPDGYELDGPIDGSRPASYYINLRSTAIWPKFDLPTLCAHEGLPGHVWQGNFVKDLPPIRSQLMFNAYVEGWALYAEQLAGEYGLYADDPLGRLGYLRSIQFRACRLVVDTGIHAKRWGFDQALDWFAEGTGNPREQLRAELNRYCSWPGQACGYKMGHNEIDRVRTRAMKALGKRFDLRRFDDAIVLGGNMPLTLLEGVTDRYVAAARG